MANYLFSSYHSQVLMLGIISASRVHGVSQLDLYDLLVTQPDLVPELGAGGDQLLLLGEERPELEELRLSRVLQQTRLDLRRGV